MKPGRSTRRTGRSFLVALAFLTTVPVPFRELPSEKTLACARAWFPMIGLLLGAALGGLAALSARWLPASIGAFFVLLAWVALTGALHLDGLCDLCDGLFGGRTIEERLRIMQDPRLGTFGLAGGVLMLLGKFAALQSLWPSAAPWLVGSAVITARCLVLCVAAGSRYPRDEGTGKVLVESVRGWESVPFALSGLIAAVAGPVLQSLAISGTLRWTSVVVGLACFAPAFGSMIALRWLCHRCLAGVTGDCLGAAIEITEIIVLCSAAALMPLMPPVSGSP